jgi:hypothetical protein
VSVRRIAFAVLFAVATSPCRAAAESTRIDVDSLRCAAAAGLPANLVIGDEFLWSLTSEMVRRSPTFQRQMAVIGNFTQVRAKIRLVARAPSAAFVAHSTIQQTAAGFVLADVQIPRRLLFANGYVELIAHELEHVIEQAEGIDLPDLAAKPDSGVYTLAWGSGRPFETVRAQAIGRVVAREYAEHDAAACDAGLP